jgi:hypothetical protein
MRARLFASLFGIFAVSTHCFGNEVLIYRGIYKRDLNVTSTVPKKERILSCLLAIDPQPVRPGNNNTEEVFFSGIVYGREAGIMRQRRLYSRTLQWAPGSSLDGLTAYVANRTWLGSSVVLAASTRDIRFAWSNGQFFLKGDLDLIIRPRSADEIWYGPYYPLRDLPRKLSGMLMDQIVDDTQFPLPLGQIVSQSIAAQWFYQRAEFSLKRDDVLSANYRSPYEIFTVFDAVEDLEAALEAKGYAKTAGFWH